MSAFAGKADMPIALRNVGHGHFLIDLDRRIRLPGRRLRVHILELLGAAWPVARFTQLFELLRSPRIVSAHQYQ